MKLPVDDEFEQALNELMAAEGTSRQETVKRAVIDRRDRILRHARIERITDEMIVEYADAFRRLGSD